MELCKKIVIAVMVVAVMGCSQKMYAAARGEPLPVMYSELCKAVRENNMPEVISLIQQKAPANYVTPCSGETLLMIAAQHNSVDVIPLLVSAGVDVNAVDRLDWRLGYNAVIYASKRGHVAAVRTLLKAGADGARVDRAQWNMLRHAADAGYADVVRIALAVNPCITPLGMDWWEALQHAIQKGHIDVARVLLAIKLSFSCIQNNYAELMRVVRFNVPGSESDEWFSTHELMIPLLVMSHIECATVYHQDDSVPQSAQRALLNALSHCFQAEQEAGTQDWNAQELIDSGVLRVMFGDRLDNQITKEEQDANNHRGSIQQLITRLADPLQSENIDGDSVVHDSLRECIAARIGLHREQRLLAAERQRLIKEGIVIKRIADENIHEVDENSVMAGVQIKDREK